MMPRNNLLDNYQGQILFIELAGLLHDLGKLSAAFLSYRKNWQNQPHGYDKDPHEHEFLKNDVTIPSSLRMDFSKTIKDLFPSSNIFKELSFSIEKAVNEHTQPRANDDIMRMLKASDANDANYDRNNPLWSQEQKQEIYRSNVFGYEKNRIVAFAEQEDSRQALYNDLGESLSEYLRQISSQDDSRSNRKKILRIIKNAFDCGLSDTTRPDNDTTLWEHSYAVASILKVMTANRILAFGSQHNSLVNSDSLDPYCDNNVLKYGILGIGWDGERFISFGHKIPDIIGRKAIIDQIQKKLTELIEYEYPIGNTIYEDSDGVYFIIPRLFNQAHAELKNIVDNRIMDIFASISHRELQPNIDWTVDDTPSLTSLVKTIKNIKAISSFRFKNEHHTQNDHLPSLRKLNEPKTAYKSICPICRLREIEDSDEKIKICKICKERRKPHDSDFDSNLKETRFSNEIADKNKRMVLLVARFGLDKWLDGTMIRSLFIKEAKDLEKEIANLGSVVQFQPQESPLIAYYSDPHNSSDSKYDYSRISADIESIWNCTPMDRASRIAFLYERRVLYRKNTKEFAVVRNKEEIEAINNKWRLFLEAAKAEHGNILNDFPLLVNIVAAKTPTPSTILDVWRTTRKFNRDEIGNILRNNLEEKKRTVLFVPDFSNESEISPKDIYDAFIIFSGKRYSIEVMFVKSNQFEIIGYIDLPKDIHNATFELETSPDNWKSYKNVDIKPNEGSGYLPCRIITATPNLFMALIPADRALNIASKIQHSYMDQFGKVVGRLPLCIGQIFFDYKMPMFVVLDAGRRMLQNFDEVFRTSLKARMGFNIVGNHKSDNHQSLSLEWDSIAGRRSWVWNIPDKLGNCGNDYHHPYLLISGKNNDDKQINRLTFFDTVAGKAVHVSEITSSDIIEAYPNYFDYEFLDSTIRRYDLIFNENDEIRKSSVTGFTCHPMLLEELVQKVLPLWKNIIQAGAIAGLTDTKLRNLQSLWLTKYQEWRVNHTKKDSLEYKAWLRLVTDSVKREITLDTNTEKEWIDLIENGLFFDALELFLGIMKERIDQQRSDDNERKEIQF